jgi:hypothetical protein
MSSRYPLHSHHHRTPLPASKGEFDIDLLHRRILLRQFPLDQSQPMMLGKGRIDLGLRCRRRRLRSGCDTALNVLCCVLVPDHGLVQRGTALPYQASGDDLGEEGEDQQEELEMGPDKVMEEVRESGIGVDDASQRRDGDCDLIANDGRLVMTPDRTARRDTLRPCACAEDGKSSGVVPECHSRRHHEHACLDPCSEHLQSIDLHRRSRSLAWV